MGAGMGGAARLATLITASFVRASNPNAGAMLGAGRAGQNARVVSCAGLNVTDRALRVASAAERAPCPPERANSCPKTENQNKNTLTSA